jgi:hypothetical protein
MEAIISAYRSRVAQAVYDVVVSSGTQFSHYVVMPDGLTILSFIHDGDGHVDRDSERVALEDLPEAVRRAVELLLGPEIIHPRKLPLMTMSFHPELSDQPAPTVGEPEL